MGLLFFCGTPNQNTKYYMWKKGTLNLLESDYLSLSPGANVEQYRKGRLDEISGRLDEISAGLKFRARFERTKRNLKAKLKAGAKKVVDSPVTADVGRGVANVVKAGAKTVGAGLKGAYDEAKPQVKNLVRKAGSYIAKKGKALLQRGKEKLSKSLEPDEKPKPNGS
jgi:hypothetical protein